MCDEIGVLERGRLIARGNVATIQQQLMADKEIIIKVAGEIEPAVRFFEEDPNVTAIEKEADSGTLKFYFKGSREEQIALLKKAYLADLAIYSATEVEKDLEDVFMAITKGAEAHDAKTV